MMISEEKIRNWKDYIEPQNLALLRRCNIKYSEALHYFKKQKWKKAREAYIEFTKMNLIDFDGFYELGKCCLELGYFTECVKNWSKAQRIEPENQKLKEELIKAKDKILEKNKNDDK